jgi:hypothetical protein
LTIETTRSSVSRTSNPRIGSNHASVTTRSATTVALHTRSAAFAISSSGTAGPTAYPLARVAIIATIATTAPPIQLAGSIMRPNVAPRPSPPGSIARPPASTAFRPMPALPRLRSSAEHPIEHGAHRVLVARLDHRHCGFTPACT